MLIEILYHFFGQKMYLYIKDLLTEQILFNLFNQNMHIIQNFISAVHLQQTQADQLNHHQILTSSPTTLKKHNI